MLFLYLFISLHEKNVFFKSLWALSRKNQPQTDDLLDMGI